MSLFEFFKGIEYFYLNLFKVNEYSQKHKSSKDYNSTFLSLNRYFYLKEAETVSELENQAKKPFAVKIRASLYRKKLETRLLAPEKVALQQAEGLAW
jgi:hypothetical protein